MAEAENFLIARQGISASVVSQQLDQREVARRLAAHPGLHLPERQAPVHRDVSADDDSPCIALDRVSSWGGEPPGSGPAPSDPLYEVLSPVDSPSRVTSTRD
jgi:hypothetical protein